MQCAPERNWPRINQQLREGVSQQHGGGGLRHRNGNNELCCQLCNCEKGTHNTDANQLGQNWHRQVPGARTVSGGDKRCHPPPPPVELGTCTAFLPQLVAFWLHNSDRHSGLQIKSSAMPFPRAGGYPSMPFLHTERKTANATHTCCLALTLQRSQARRERRTGAFDGVQLLGRGGGHPPPLGLHWKAFTQQEGIFFTAFQRFPMQQRRGGCASLMGKHTFLLASRTTSLALRFRSENPGPLFFASHRLQNPSERGDPGCLQALKACNICMLKQFICCCITKKQTGMYFKQGLCQQRRQPITLRRDASGIIVSARKWPVHLLVKPVQHEPMVALLSWGSLYPL